KIHKSELNLDIKKSIRENNKHLYNMTSEEKWEKLTFSSCC
ncbi:unnamed protein product, partial [marine sediment metagenome]